MLNAMSPKEKDAHAEELWNFVAMFSEFEIENRAEGCDLDEMGIHRVFERIGMIHFPVFNYGSDWVEVVNSPHGGNAEGIEKAKQMLEEVTRAFAESTAEAAKKADEAAKVALDDANVKAGEAANEEKHAALQRTTETGSS